MNELTLAEQFRLALNDYHPNDDVKKVLAAIRLLLFVAPTATGRDTIIHELLKTDHYFPLITDTTREPRINNGIPEQQGREYWFRSEQEMLKEIAQGNMAGPAIIHNQQVSGIGRNQLIAAQLDGKIAVTDIDVVGAMDIHRIKPDSIVLFMIPLSFDIWMERLRARGEMSPDELERRMRSAERELTAALRADYFRFILNDTLEGSTAEIDRLVMTGEYDPFKERVVREIAEQMLEEVQKYLGSHSHHMEG